MVAKLTRMTHKIAIQLHIVAESCIICSSRSRRTVRKNFDKPSYYLRGSFAEFVGSPYYSEYEFCGGAVTVCTSYNAPPTYRKRAADRLP
jgi:hypothetical protein